MNILVDTKKTRVEVSTEIFDLYMAYLRPEQRFVDPDIDEENVYLVDKKGNILVPLVRKDKQG